MLRRAGDIQSWNYSFTKPDTLGETSGPVETPHGIVRFINRSLIVMLLGFVTVSIVQYRQARQWEADRVLIDHTVAHMRQRIITQERVRSDNGTPVPPARG